jgi:LacI family transcriptional regulator
MSLQRRVTLKDIAERAGVHQTTVSMALRNHPELPMATRERLKNLAEKMGYKPDPALSALRACRSSHGRMSSRYSIAWITGMETAQKWRESDVYVRCFKGIEQRAAQLGYHIEHFWYDEQTVNKAIATRILTARNISGVLFSGARQSKIPELEWKYFACASMTQSLQSIPIPLITNDHLHTVRLAFSRLCALGYKRIGLVMNQGSDDHLKNVWSVGFLGEQALLPVERRVPLYKPKALEEDSFLDWLRTHSPDVVLTIPPNLLILKWIANSGLRVPEQVGVATLDCRGEEILSGVYQHPEVTGRTAVDIIAGLIQRNDLGLQEHPMEILTRGTWIDGQTTRAQSS